MKIKKLFSGIICASMLLASIPFTYATDNTADNWNYSLVTETTKSVYEDFPMIIDNTIGRNMSMSLQLQYLKNISAEDSVSVEITDLSDNTVVEEYLLSQNNSCIVWDNVANDKSFSVVIYENLDGIEKEYHGVINTKYIRADFPADLTIGNVEYDNNNGEVFDHIAIKKVGTQARCNHGADEPCTDSCKSASLIDMIMPEELDTFYAELDSDSIYEMQMEATYEDVTEFYRGYISTYPDGEQQGIFTRGYTFSVAPDEAEVNAAPFALTNNGGISTMSIDPADYDFSTAYVYETYQEEIVTDLTGYSDYIIKWTVPEEGFYTIQTLGNMDTQLDVFSETDNEIVYTTSYYDGGTGGNVSKSIWIRGGIVRYFVLNKEDGDSGTAAFRIIRDDYVDLDDGISAYRSEVKAAYEAGGFSPIENSCEIRYNGDINIFAYNATNGIGNLVFENVGTQLTAKVGTIYNTVGGFDQVWNEGTYTIIVDDKKNAYPHEFSKEIHYIDIEQSSFSVTIDEEDSYSYGFSFYDARQRDAVELAIDATYGDNPGNPVVLTALPYSNDTRTLHRGDSDWFKFTTGQYGGTADIKVYATGAVAGTSSFQPTVALYAREDVEVYEGDSPSWSTPDESLGTITAEVSEEGTAYNRIVCQNLQPNCDYIVEVNRPSSSIYSSVNTYEISINVELPPPTATLSGNVTLTHTVGNDISDLSAMLSVIMESMTCTQYGVAVDDAAALADVELYCDGEVLTAATVNSLAAGTYTIVPKYNGVAATGGTVTLVVEAAVVEEKVEVSVPTSIEYITEYDWLHCAKALADFRLLREGSAASTLSEDDVADMLGINPDAPTRGTLYQTYKATCYFYSNGQSSSNTGFQRVTNSNAVTESALYDMLTSGNIVIMQLGDSTATTDTTKMRYLIVCGVNKTTHQLRIYDCLNTTNLLLRWVDTSDIFDGGYDATNSNIKFLGSIIEVSTN